MAGRGWPGKAGGRTITRASWTGRRSRRSCGMAFALILAGCAYAGSPKPPATLEEEFARAKKEYEEGHYFDAVQMLTAFIDQHPGSILVDQAIYVLGRSYMGQKDWILAATEFERLVRDFPESRHACDAEFALGYCYWRDSRKPSYDQEETHRTIDQMRRYADRCPEHGQRAEADSIVALARDRLAEKRFRAAELYKRLGQPESGIIYCSMVADEFADTRWLCPARRLKAELLNRVLRRDEARAELEWLRQNCPQEPGLGALERELDMSGGGS